MKDAPGLGAFEQLNALSEKYDALMNKGDAAGLAALFTNDAVVVTDSGPLKGRQAIEKWYADFLQALPTWNNVSKPDQDGSHLIGTADGQAWVSGAWSATFQGETGDLVQLVGYWSAIEGREGDNWKFRTLTWNITPAPPSPTATPSSQ